jgi:hypothetical protein
MCIFKPADLRHVRAGAHTGARETVEANHVLKPDHGAAVAE